MSLAKKKEILPFSAWVNLKDIVQSEIRQTQKERYCLISLYGESKEVELTEIVDNWLPGAGGRGNGEMLVKGYKVSVVQNE